MKAWHGVDDLLAAFGSVRRDVSDAQLLLVGGGPEEHALRRHEVALAPENAVVFTGQVEQDQVPGYVRRFDVAVAPYRPQDDFYFYPLKVLEYLAAGVPVVYSDQGALAQIVGPAGLGYQPGSVDALADRIRSLLSDDGLRMRLAALAPAQASGADWAAVADQVVRFSDTVVAAR
jgi:glycosyltransferase involved in cell wall biosynthesis